MCMLAAAVLALRSTPMNPIGSCDWNHSSLKSIEKGNKQKSHKLLWMYICIYTHTSVLELKEIFDLLVYSICHIPYNRNLSQVFFNFANYKWFTKIKASTCFLFILFQSALRFTRLLLRMQPLRFFAMFKSNYFKPVGNCNGEQQVKLYLIILACWWRNYLLQLFQWQTMIAIESSMKESSTKTVFYNSTHKDEISKHITLKS